MPKADSVFGTIGTLKPDVYADKFAVYPIELNTAQEECESMAKCPVCQSRKAKRKCLVTEEGYICSLCCGVTRREETCSGCSYYHPPQRKYHEVPSYTPAQMDASDELQEYSYAIEGAIGKFDRRTGRKIKDEVPICIYEKLLDKYHFKDRKIIFENELLEGGFTQVEDAIKSDLQKVDEEKLAKVLGVLHFIAKRRTRGHREYLAVVEQFVGERVGPGMRVVGLPPELQ